MLAYNEDEVIENTINQVLEQDIFMQPKFDVQLAIIANGCTDKTVEVAQEAIICSEKTNLSVVNIQQAGKSNAWNTYVHEIAWQDAEYILLVDADIELIGNDSLSKLVQQLEVTPEAVVSIDSPKKDVEKKEKKNPLEKFSLLLSKANKKNHNAITGQLYCIRGSVVREIFLPLGLPVEDGFISAMVHTENFTSNKVGAGKLTLEKSVTHYFHALTKPSELIKHEKRLMIGSAINSMIFNYLWANVKEPKQHAGILIANLNSAEAQWLERLVGEYKEKRGFWFVPKRIIFKHYLGWRKSKLGYKKLLKVPMVLSVTFVYLCLAINVNLYFKNKNGVGHW